MEIKEDQFLCRICKKFVLDKCASIVEYLFFLKNISAYLF